MRRRSRKGKGKRPKRTKPDASRGPQRLAKDERRATGAKEAAELRADFERRKHQQIARAALELDHVDAEILRLMLTHPAITHHQIAACLGLARRQTVTERINASKFQRAIEIANRSALEIFEANKARAARVLGELLGSEDERVKIRAAIAHMWPHIHVHDDGKTSAADFVRFIEEAYELANTEAATLAPTDSKR